MANYMIMNKQITCVAKDKTLIAQFDFKNVFKYHLTVFSGHHPFLEAHRFPYFFLELLSRKISCLLLETDNDNDFNTARYLYQSVIDFVFSDFLLAMIPLIKLAFSIVHLVIIQPLTIYSNKKHTFCRNWLNILMAKVDLGSRNRIGLDWIIKIGLHNR